MVATRSEFDSLWSSVNTTMDTVFAKPFKFRARGQVIDIVASLGAHVIEARPEQEIFDSWHGHRFMVNASYLVIDGETFEPEPGMEIAEELPDGRFDIYRVLAPPKSRCFDPIDAEEDKLLIYTKHVKTESA